MAIINTGWLVNEDKVFAPKTLISQVVDNNGRTLENTLQYCNKQPYAVCYDSSMTTTKNVYCNDYDISSGHEITIKFINNAYVSPTIYLNVNNTNAYPITYQGKTRYINIKANGIYKFKFTGEAWEIIGDINPSDLSGFGINVSSTEINYVKGATENIPEQINKLKQSVSNNISNTIATITRTQDPNDEEKNPISIVAPSNGIVTMSGRTNSSIYSGIWMKLNGIEMFKLVNEEEGSKTAFHKYSVKVNEGDVVEGNATSFPMLEFFPTE